MKIGYARVSTKDQTVALQVDALKKAGCNKVYTEVMSGARSDRPILAKLLEYLRPWRHSVLSGSKYINWLIGQAVTAKVKVDALITTEALALLSQRLTTPLQFEQYLTRAFEEAYKIGQKPVSADIVESVLAPDIDILDARLVRNGYNVKNLCELLNAKPREINAFIRGQLPPERTQQLSSQLLVVGVPL
jgi:hypothetical protein